MEEIAWLKVFKVCSCFTEMILLLALKSCPWQKIGGDNIRHEHLKCLFGSPDHVQPHLFILNIVSSQMLMLLVGLIPPT